MLLFPFRYIRWLVTSLWRSLGKPPGYVVFVVEGDMPPLPDRPRPFWQRFTSRPRLSVKELGERFAAIGLDTRIKGVVLHLRATALPMASLEDLREQIAELRKAGKRVVAWAPFFSTGTYFLACACDEILLMPTGQVMPLGFSRTGTFLADGLARLGISADFIQISPYKTAADPVTKSKMSDEFRKQVTWLLESQHAELVSAVSAGRDLDDAGARALIDQSPFGDDVAVAKHAVDAVLGEEDLSRHLGRGTTGAVTLGTWDQARRKMASRAPTLGRGPYIALLRIEGTIVDGRSGRLPVTPPVEIPLLGDDRAGDLTVVQAARLVAADKRAAAAVIYVNSRGGSSTASEAMRQALAAIASTRPVVVAMGPIAGSGGYLVAISGSWIVARPSTLTGSIGVLTGKIVTGPMWSKLLFNRETIAFGEHATLYGDEKPYSDEERGIVQAEVDRIYSAFLGVVARARKMTVAELDPMAGGRVWTGRQALERKLVDELGGLEAAVSKARGLAKLDPKTRLREVRAPRHPLAPPPFAAATDWLGYVLESLSMLARSPALTVMDYLPPR